MNIWLNMRNLKNFYLASYSIKDNLELFEKKMKPNNALYFFLVSACSLNTLTYREASRNFFP